MGGTGNREQGCIGFVSRALYARSIMNRYDHMFRPLCFLKTLEVEVESAAIPHTLSSKITRLRADDEVETCTSSRRSPKSKIAIGVRKIVGLLTGIAIAGAPQVAAAQSNIEYIPPPPDQGAPTGRRQGGATRGDCLAYQDLTALVPQVEGVVWSQAASATPSFFFYVPEALTSAIPIEFVIQDSDDNYAVYQEFMTEAEAGILAVPVASDAAGLELDQTYTWTFSIYCDAERPSASVSVSGTFKRVADPVADTPNTALDPAAQLEQIQQYAAAGIWHDAIAGAIALHQADPTKCRLSSNFRNPAGTSGSR